MAHKLPPRPTDAELEILAILWRKGQATVREVHESLEREPKIGYTTVLKLLQIMADKGLVTRDESKRSHVYAPHSSEEKTQTQLVRDLLDRAFGGSPSQLVMRALHSKEASPKEIEEIRRLLDDLEGKA